MYVIILVLPVIPRQFKYVVSSFQPTCKVPPLGPHPVQKSSWKMQRQPQTLCCVPRILVPLPNVCFHKFWSSWNPNCCIFQECWPSWNQNCCIFQGFGSSCCLSHHTWETRLQDQGAHAYLIFYFNSSLQKKSASRNCLLIRKRAPINKFA